MESVIKKDIVEYIYQHHGGMTREEVEEYTDQLLDLLGDAIHEDPSVTITHFGRFKHKTRSVREVIMPSGDKVLSASGERIQFLPSPQLKTRLNSEPTNQAEEDES